jgi:hypothetical protein
MDRSVLTHYAFAYVLARRVARPSVMGTPRGGAERLQADTGEAAMTATVRQHRGGRRSARDRTEREPMGARDLDHRPSTDVAPRRGLWAPVDRLAAIARSTP